MLSPFPSAYSMNHYFFVILFLTDRPLVATAKAGQEIEYKLLTLQTCIAYSANIKTYSANCGPHNHKVL